MVEDDDWRLDIGGSNWEGRKFVFMQYWRWSETWDHDHCCFCAATFMLDSSDPEVLTEGYAEIETSGRVGYYWVCSICFDDFKDRFAWFVESDGMAASDG